jgi:hypothetical protein
MKVIYYPLCLLILFFTGCSKSENDQTPSGPINPPGPTVPSGPSKIKIEILSGNNQSDTIGQLLQDSIVIKLTRGDTLLKNYEMLFTDTSCFEVTTTRKTTSTSGLANYSWKLNSTSGTQKLKISLYDSVLNVSDSVFVTAEAKVPESVWWPGSCLPEAIINSLAQLKSGRILCGLNMTSPPYYSDDNGQSWQKLSSAPSVEVQKIVIGANDEIFMATQSSGIFYSGDNGKTWQQRTNGITNSYSFTDFKLLKSGKLVAATYFGGIFLSTDNGLNWTPISGTLNYNDRFYNLSESPSGDLYTVTDLEELWTTTNNGASWTKVAITGFSTDVQSIFFDDNGDQYVAVTGDDGYIKKSTDNGLTWTTVYTTPLLPGTYDRILRLSKKGDYFYFTVAAYGLMRTKDFVSFNKLSEFHTEYLAADNGTVLTTKFFGGMLFNRHP